MNAVATPTRPKAKKKATPSIARQQDNSKILAPTDHGVEPNFMQGKALAALMIREALSYDDGGLADLNASYRDAGELQSNFTEAFLQLLLKEPHLLPGFSAALSSMLAQGLENHPDIPESAATISYEACTKHRAIAEYEKWASHTEPALDEQIAYFGLQDLEGGDTRYMAEPVAEQSTSPVMAPSDSSIQLMDKAVQHAEPKIAQAVHLLGLCAENGDGSAVWGLLRLAETIKPQLDAGFRSYVLGTPVTNVLTDLSCSILELIALICAVNAELDDLTLHAVESILGMAKAIVDDASEKVMEAQREVAK